MTFFKKLFGPKKAASENNFHTEVPQEALFVDTMAPPAAIDNISAAKAEPAGAAKMSIHPAALRQFLEIDFWQRGREQALQFPTVNRKESALKKIRADYRLVLNKVMQQVQADIEAHEQESLRLKGISEIIDMQMKRRAGELERFTQQLEQQLELSIDDEGWLAPIIAAYNDGFTEGALQYMRTNELLGGINAMH